MCLLIFLFTSAVFGAPFNSSWDSAAPPTGNASSSSAAVETSEVGFVLLNATQNATSTPQNVSTFDPSTSNDTAETLEELEDDVDVSEGDILQSWDRNAGNTVWSDAVVFYRISEELSHRKDDIVAAFRMISDVSCIRFKKRSDELNYVQLRDGRGCASFVGCRGGVQSLYFAASCSVGNLVHELLHALGLYHEHTRPDRDRYVSVLWDSILPGKERNFKVKHGNTLGLRYDLGSIMHYGKYFFSANGSPTVLAKQGGEEMGQRRGLSGLDVQRLNTLYHCDERRKSERN